MREFLFSFIFSAIPFKFMFSTMRQSKTTKYISIIHDDFVKFMSTPYLKPPEVAFLGPPGGYITPSREMKERTIIFLI